MHIVICLFCFVWFSDANIFPEYVLPQMVSYNCKNCSLETVLVISTLLHYYSHILSLHCWLYVFLVPNRCTFSSIPCRVLVLGSLSSGSSYNGASDICREYSSASRDSPQVLLLFILLSLSLQKMCNVFFMLELQVF